MLIPIMTPSHTAVMFADGSASRMGATMGTTTTAISMKSRKNPRKKMTAITTTNWVQNPPGRLVRCSRTSSSPPNARNAEVSMAAPRRMMNTMDVVLAVSIITPLRVSSIRYARHRLHRIATRSPAVPIEASAIPWTSSGPVMFLTLMS